MVESLDQVPVYTPGGEVEREVPQSHHPGMSIAAGEVRGGEGGGGGGEERKQKVGEVGEKVREKMRGAGEQKEEKVREVREEKADVVTEEVGGGGVGGGSGGRLTQRRGHVTVCTLPPVCLHAGQESASPGPAAEQQPQTLDQG